MSRLSSIVEKPYTKTLQFKNEKFDKKLKKVVQEKGWYYYVPSTIEGEKGTNVMLEMPITALWLLSATSFSGFNESEGVSIYSNEVLSERDLKEFFPKKEEEGVEEYYTRLKSYMVLTAKMGKETIATGFYKDIKDTVVAKGGKYCQPNYFLLVNKDGSTEIVRFLFSGASIETWIPFSSNKSNLTKMAVKFEGSVDKQKGSNDYEAPLFEFVPIEAKYSKEADKAAQVVVDYFKFLLEGNTAEVKEELVETSDSENELPWEN